jgi:hypothetical protein
MYTLTTVTAIVAETLDDFQDLTSLILRRKPKLYIENQPRNPKEKALRFARSMCLWFACVFSEGTEIVFLNDINLL